MVLCAEIHLLIVAIMTYFKEEDFKHYADKFEYICPAHVFVRYENADDYQELVDALQKGDVKKIREADNKLGTLYDRLPSV
jgi:hypothetical protein